MGSLTSHCAITFVWVLYRTYRAAVPHTDEHTVAFKASGKRWCGRETKGNVWIRLYVGRILHHHQYAPRVTNTRTHFQNDEFLTVLEHHRITKEEVHHNGKDKGN